MFAASGWHAEVPGNWLMEEGRAQEGSRCLESELLLPFFLVHIFRGSLS